MIRPPRLWRPSSFSEVGLLKSRSLSIFVALAAERSRYTEAAQRDMRTGVIGLVLIALALGGFSLRVEPAPLVGAIGLGIALWGAAGTVRRRQRGELLDRPVDATRLSRRRTIAQLNQSRKTIGLDRALPPGTVTVLETAANEWERITHALQAQTWAGHRELRHRVDLAALDLMEEFISIHCGSLIAERLVKGNVPMRAEEISQALRKLALLVEETSVEMDAYSRPLGISAGAPLGKAFPAAASLNEWLEQQWAQ